MIQASAVIAIAAALLVGCAHPAHYEWGGYEDSLYHYYKDPTKAADHLEVLAVAARTGDASGKTAPGVHAEYGYMLLTAGRNAEAVQEFEIGRRIWPESAVFMNRMIGLASGHAAPATAKTTMQSSPGKVGS